MILLTISRAPFLTGSDNIHHLFIHFFSHTLLRMGAPLDAAQGIIVCDKSAMLAGHLGINGKQFDLMSTLGADFFNNRGGTGGDSA